MIRKKQLKIELAAVLQANRLLHNAIDGLKAELDLLTMEKEDLLATVEYLQSTPNLRGRDNRPKLTQSEVQEIRDMKRSGVSQADLAQMFDVNPATISRIVRWQYHKLNIES
jgi:hypothetical protein